MDRKVPESYYIQDGTLKGNIFSSPLLSDIFSDNLIYQAYANITRESLTPNPILLVKKTVIDGNLITCSYAYGVWENRYTLDYMEY